MSIFREGNRWAARVISLVIKEIDKKRMGNLKILLIYIILGGEVAERDAFSLKLKRGRFESFFLLGASSVDANVEE